MAKDIYGNTIMEWAQDPRTGNYVEYNTDTGQPTGRTMTPQQAQEASPPGWGVNSGQTPYDASNMPPDGQPWQGDGASPWGPTATDPFGIPITSGTDPGAAYRDTAEQDAYERWALDQGIALANRDDNRFQLGTSGLTAAPATAGYVNLGTTPQSSGVSMGGAAMVNQVNLGSAPLSQRVALGQAQRMDAAQLGSAPQIGRVDLGSAPVSQRVDLGQALQMDAARLGPAAQMGRVDLGNAALANYYGTDATGAFDPSLAAFDNADLYNQYATNIDGSFLQDAAWMQQAAAMGLTPSEAEMMYLQGGVDTQLALDRSAQQNIYQTNQAAADLAATQMSNAARVRGSSSAGLATLNAQNQTALGQARLYADSLNQLAQNDLQYIAAGQTALNQAAAGRAREMTDARAAYGQLGEAIRAGDFQGAQNALAAAQGRLSIDEALLGVQQANVDAANANSQFNATNQNAFRQAQGQLDQARNQQNTNLLQQQQFQQADYTQAANAANQTAVNQMRQQQGALDSANNQFNASNALELRQAQGQIDANRLQQNANLLQQQQFQQADYTQAANASNQAAINQMRQQQGALDATNNQFNASNTLALRQAQGQLDATANQFNASQMQNMAQQQAQLSQQNNQYNANLAQQQAFQQGQLTQGTNQFNAGQGNQVVQQNLDRVAQIQQGNQQAAMQAGFQDDALLGQTIAFGQAARENDTANAIRAQESAMDFRSHTLDRDANRAVGAATVAQQRQANTQQQVAAIVGAGATLVGGLAAGAAKTSDRKAKKILGDAGTPDFSRTDSKHYQYKPGAGDGGKHTGPMADEMPEELVEEGEDGFDEVDIADTVMQLAAAAGDAQRRLKTLEARK